MIIDNLNILSDKQAIVATAVSTNVLDLKALGITYDGIQLQRREFLAKVPFMVQVTEDFDNLTTLEVQVQVDDNAGFTSASTIYSETVALADLVAGFQFNLDRFPRKLNEQFMRLNYIVVGTGPTVGTISAGVVTAVDAAYRG